MPDIFKNIYVARATNITKNNGTNISDEN